MVPKKGLGKGLNALIPDKPAEEAKNNAEEIFRLPLSAIEPNREQPRRQYDASSLEELAASIKNYGIIQPIIVRRNGEFFEIVAGERRWRAARLAGLRDVPVIVRDYDELKSLEVALIENVQRENLNAVEEALTYKRLQDEFSMTQEAIADSVGKKRSTIANSMRLLALSEKTLEMLSNGALSVGHAKALLSLNDSKKQEIIAEKIVEGELSVRQTEALVKAASKEKAEKSNEEEASVFSAENLIYYKSVERELNSLLGTKVKVSTGKNKGKIEIEYFSDSDLDRLVSLFKSTSSP